MAKIDKFLRAKKNKNNEFYTRYLDVKFFVENSQIKEYLRDKIVYLPCDTELSNIYKYLLDEKESLGIKEILRTSDDYYSHQDLYDKCDVVFTNPPFTGIKKWLMWLDGQNIKYISWFPTMGLYSWPEIVEQHKMPIYFGNPGSKKKTAIGDKTYNEVHNKFIVFANNGTGGDPTNMEDGTTLTNAGIVESGIKRCAFEVDENDPTILKSVSCYIISNDDYFDDFTNLGKAFTKTFEELKDKLFMTEDGYYEAKMNQYIPKDYYDPIYITLTSYIGKRHLLEYLGCKGVKGKDGKSRPRVLVKLKKQE